MGASACLSSFSSSMLHWGLGQNRRAPSPMAASASICRAGGVGKDVGVCGLAYGCTYGWHCTAPMNRASPPSGIPLHLATACCRASARRGALSLPHLAQRGRFLRRQHQPALRCADGRLAVGQRAGHLQCRVAGGEGKGWVGCGWRADLASAAVAMEPGGRRQSCLIGTMQQQKTSHAVPVQVPSMA